MISWVTSAGTLLAVWLTGRNLRLSWKVSLVNQGIWLVFIITYDAWGLLPLTLALSGIFSHHLWRTREALPQRHLSRSEGLGRSSGCARSLIGDRPRSGRTAWASCSC